MSDEEVGEAKLLLQLHEQVEDLRLDRHVEGRHGLVRNDELRVHRQRPRDADPLALTAGELMRVARGLLRPDADALQQGKHPLPRLAAPRDDAVEQHGLRQDVEDALAGVE